VKKEKVKMYISNQTIQNAVELIINTRDFCGNEKQAVKDFCAEEKIADWKKVYAIANFRANAVWNQFKKDAGVNPKYIF
jgi:hypothetical protein